MATRDIAYYKGKIQTLRSALTALLEEMEADEQIVPSAPRKRRNLREERVLQFSHDGWKKLKPIKKGQ